LAYSIGYPEVAKKDRARVFGDLYDSIFNDDITTSMLLVPLRVFSEIDAVKRNLHRKIKKGESFDRSLLFLIDGAYHVLFTVAELCEGKGIDPLDEALSKAEIQNALQVVRELVEQETKIDEAFTTNRFFKDAKTKVKIQRILAAAKPPSVKKFRKTSRPKGKENC
jgi:hypothetical protein